MDAVFLNTQNTEPLLDVSGGSDGSAIVLGNTGSGQSFNNMQPYIAMTYIIALQGVFPSRS